MLWHDNMVNMPILEAQKKKFDIHIFFKYLITNTKKLIF